MDNNNDGTRPTPDPVTQEAVRAAMAATDPPKPRHPWVTRAVIMVLSLCLLAGTVGAVFTVANTISLSHQNSDLQAEADCTQKLLQSFQSNSKARSIIAEADRNILKNLVFNISRAKTAQDVQKAFDEFTREDAANNKLRDKFPINSEITCKSLKDHGTASGGVPTPPPSESTAPSKKKSSSPVQKSTLPVGGTTSNSINPSRPAQATTAPPARVPRPSVSVTHPASPHPPASSPTVAPAPAPPIIDPRPIVTTVCKIVGLPILCQ